MTTDHLTEDEQRTVVQIVEVMLTNGKLCGFWKHGTAKLRFATMMRLGDFGMKVRSEGDDLLRIEE